ncbi:MAG: pyrroline-5-carboxylate reductase [Clostridia bacterium]|nr:pyrroline-5-carboxylate reductase [Clostridia bacterium]
MADIIRYRAGFIGCGNMGGTLAANAADSLGGDKIGVCDTDRDRVDRLVGEYGCDDADIPTLIEKSDYVFLGLKPGALRKVMPEYADCFAGREDCVVVSMAAGVTIEEIRSICGGHGKIIRIMPNLGCRVEEGMILESTDGEADDNDLDGLEEILGYAGSFERIPEALMDAGCALSGSGPAFAYIFIEALADAGVECGLSRKTAQKLAAQTVLGAAKSVLTYGNPASLKDDVCSPGGTTIAGVHALETAGFRAAAMDAVIAAYKKAKALS